jgi:predicted metal-dependent TIM-barrel fold hydrolase
MAMTIENTPMYIDPHIHMVSRTTNDYEAMKAAGVVAVIEPAFWLGQPRTESGSFKDYFSTLVGWERFRASQFGICHYCTIGLNSKEANNEALAEQAMALLPLYACKEGVVAIGEIGFDEMTKLEEKYFRQQLELARELDMLVLVHTPHRNKKEGTSRSMDTGPLSPFIRIPRWAMNAWLKSCGSMAVSASSSIVQRTGASAIRLPCQRPRA